MGLLDLGRIFTARHGQWEGIILSLTEIFRIWLNKYLDTNNMFGKLYNESINNKCCM